MNAFSPLYEAYCQRIYAYCLRRTGQPEEAEDLTSRLTLQPPLK